MNFINIGFGNVVNADKIISIVSPVAAPVKRLVQNARDNGDAVDATCGRKTKAVIIMENKTVVLSSLLPETIVTRLTFIPSIITSPPSFERVPHIMDIVVDFPAPFTPRNANNSPSFTTSDKSSTACTS